MSTRRVPGAGDWEATRLEAKPRTPVQDFDSAVKCRGSSNIMDGQAISTLAQVTIQDRHSALASMPPFRTPPLSVNLILIVAVPLALAAGVYVRSPVALIAGPAENRAAFVLFVTENVTI